MLGPGPWSLAWKQKGVVWSLGRDVCSQIMMCVQSIWFGKGGVHLEDVSVGPPQALLKPAFTNAGEQRGTGLGQPGVGWGTPLPASCALGGCWAVLTGHPKPASWRPCRPLRSPVLTIHLLLCPPASVPSSTGSPAPMRGVRPPLCT